MSSRFRRGSDDRQDAWITLEHDRDSVEQLPLTTEKGRRRRWEVDAPRAPQRPEVTGAELVDARRALEVLQPVKAEIEQLGAVEKRLRGRRDEGLTSVSEGGDARAAVEVLTDVTLARQRRRSSVKADAHSDRPWHQCFMRRRRPLGSLGCRREGDEEGVALRVHLDSVRGSERVAEECPMRCESIAYD